ncbi:MAG TPA: EamA family transporter [Gammaproteobacteria bacterium]|jgi:drug/metabolite transporter (DMT)-like permease|nr:EamA family transporter [Gammaproteobacteria bacterium]
MSVDHRHASPARIALGFTAVYILWGSTYLGIRFAVASMPPFLMAGTRHLIAGFLLYILFRLRGEPKPTRVHWRSATLLGGLLLLGGNGLVSVAEQTVPSGIAALMVAAVPFWMVLLNALEKGAAPRLSVLAGLALGVVGLMILVFPSGGHAPDHVDPTGIWVLLAATFSWAMGSLYAHRAPLPSSTFLGIGMEMIAGGLLCWLVGLVSGEGAVLHLAAFTPKSLLALGYLIVFGSLLGFSAYVWLLKVTTPARASTYAFVNPVIAVLLGWALAGEPLTPRIALAGATIVAAVCLILYFGATRAKPESAPET